MFVQYFIKKHVIPDAELYFIIVLFHKGILFQTVERFFFSNHCAYNLPFLSSKVLPSSVNFYCMYDYFCILNFLRGKILKNENGNCAYVKLYNRYKICK